MSSNIPTRRVTRTTRATTLKESENANARPTRLATRAKPPSNSAATTSVTTRAAGAAAAKAKPKTVSATEGSAQGKRKRAALGEVTKPPNRGNENKVGAGKPPSKQATTKGKGENADVKKPPSKVGTTTKAGPTKVAATKTTASSTRVPLGTVGGTTTGNRRTRSAAVQPLEDVNEEEEPMAVDAAPAHPHRAASRTIAKAEVATKVTVSTTHAVEKRVEKKTSTRSIASTRSAATEEEQEDEAQRAFKKRRTSPDPGDGDRDTYEVETREARDAELAQAFAEQLERASMSMEKEADPDGDEWEDLDADDADDPLMVSEYVVDIFEYLKEVEQTTMPNPNYMENQKELAWKMRAILTDWLIQIHFRFRLLPETLFLCTNIMDRFLSARVVSVAKLQLVGITCLFIASKTEEIVSPSVVNFLQCADSSYTDQDILQAERYVLKTLDWNLSYPNPIHFLRRVSKADDYDVQARTIGKYLMEISIVEWRLLPAPPSLLAAAAVWLARLILGRDEWTPNLAHYSSYSESQLIPTAGIMLNYVLRPVRHPTFWKKYASKKYLKASTFVQAWALERWPEGTQVTLKDDLAVLKAEIRAYRERTEAGAENGVAEAEYDEAAVGEFEEDT
ncbi:hypothetical protein OE88DRAFT_1663020 [Heliocybe sulcata]|uniref:Cyclin N-terminal domain-containing protein n=1 Tax=Heliocybe sulcata TaxID=5364 RepID=A0A5C3MVD6_9AGAM|nr:hypothetical protein OE88DRAFT_1663020 [Heliocybe sulcata]